VDVCPTWPQDALEAGDRVICARWWSIRDLRSRGVTGAITAASMAWAKPSGKHLSSLMYFSANSFCDRPSVTGRDSEFAS